MVNEPRQWVDHQIRANQKVLAGVGPCGRVAPYIARVDQWNSLRNERYVTIATESDAIFNRKAKAIAAKAHALIQLINQLPITYKKLLGSDQPVRDEWQVPCDY